MTSRDPNLRKAVLLWTAAVACISFVLLIGNMMNDALHSAELKTKEQQLDRLGAKLKEWDDALKREAEALDNLADQVHKRQAVVEAYAEALHQKELFMSQFSCTRR